MPTGRDAFSRRVSPRTRARRDRITLGLSAISSALIGGGAILLLYVIALEKQWLPMGDFTLPEPVALQQDERAMRQAVLDLEGEQDDLETVASVNPAATMAVGNGEPASGSPPPGELSIAGIRLPIPGRGPAAVSAPRAPTARPQGPPVVEGPLPDPGVASRLTIPAIGLTATVVAGGMTVNQAGELEWQTAPFVAVHYASDTGLVGSKGNPVLAGHVVTMSQGNVFRDLYRLLPGDRVIAQTQDGARFVYQVMDIRLVDPADVEVMNPTSDAGLTLITCAGTFDSRTRSFTKRLIVVGSLLGAAAA